MENILKIRSKNEDDIITSNDLIYLLNTLNNACFILSDNNKEYNDLLSPYKIRTFVRAENVVFIKKINKNSPLDLCLLIKSSCPIFDLLQIISNNLSDSQTNVLFQKLLKTGNDFYSLIKALRFINNLFIFIGNVCS